MYATVVSLVIALFLLYFPPEILPQEFLLLSLLVGLFLLLLPLLFLALLTAPLYKAEQNLTSRVIELVKKDSTLNLTLKFLLISPLLLLGALLTGIPHKELIVILLLGIGIDLLKLFCFRLIDHLDPFKVVDFLKEAGLKSIDNGDDLNLCRSLESMSDIGKKAINLNSITLLNHSIEAIKDLSVQFLHALKSISYPIQDEQLQKEGVKDTLSYVILQFLQHLESLFNETLNKKMEISASLVTMAYTQIAKSAAKVDITLTALPLYYIDKASIKAFENKNPDISIKITLGLIELSKTIAALDNVSFLEIKTPFTTIISILETNAKELFKQDKKIKIALLMNPFKEIEELLQKEPMLKNHKDQEIIQKQVTKVLIEFQSLEQVMRAMPPPERIRDER